MKTIIRPISNPSKQPYETVKQEIPVPAGSLVSYALGALYFLFQDRAKRETFKSIRNNVAISLGEYHAMHVKGKSE